MVKLCILSPKIKMSDLTNSSQQYTRYHSQQIQYMRKKHKIGKDGFKQKIYNKIAITNNASQKN